MPTSTSTPAPIVLVCDYSGTDEPVIKGNIGSGGDRIYHTPDSPYYERTRIDESEGERWFCTEAAAVAFGWRPPSKPTVAATPVSTPMPTSTSTPVPTATPMPSPTATATETPTPQPTVLSGPEAPGSSRPDVQITCIFFDGVVSGQEPDEYVEISNLGDDAQDLTGWRLVDMSEGWPEFVFPSWPLLPSRVVRVYTNEVHPEWGGFSFQHGSAVWNNNNSDPDTAGLYNDSGDLIWSISYPPGCE